MSNTILATILQNHLRSAPQNVAIKTSIQFVSWNCPFQARLYFFKRSINNWSWEQTTTQQILILYLNPTDFSAHICKEPPPPVQTPAGWTSLYYVGGSKTLQRVVTNMLHGYFLFGDSDMEVGIFYLKTSCWLNQPIKKILSLCGSCSPKKGFT